MVGHLGPRKMYFQKTTFVFAKTLGSKQISGNWRKSFPNPKPQAMEKEYLYVFQPGHHIIGSKVSTFQPLKSGATKTHETKNPLDSSNNVVESEGGWEMDHNLAPKFKTFSTWFITYTLWVQLTNIATWNISKKKKGASFRGPHFPASYC